MLCMSMSYSPHCRGVTMQLIRGEGIAMLCMSMSYSPHCRGVTMPLIMGGGDCHAVYEHVL